MSAEGWVAACKTDDINAEDVTSFEHDGPQLCDLPQPGRRIFRHRRALHARAIPARRRLRDGRHHRVPKHNGRFNYKTGKAKGAPVCIDLKTYPAKVEDGTVFIKID